MNDSNRVENPTGTAQIVDNRPCFFKYITAIARTWGILTSISLWYMTLLMIKHAEEYHYVQWYSIALSIVVTFFEMVWILTKCACCKDDGNCCCTLWRIVIWVDNWKKAILYIALSLPTFSEPSLGIICGVLVIVLAVFYLFKTCKYSECIKNKRRQTHFVETECPRADLVSHEIQTATSEYSAAGQTFTTIEETIPEDSASPTGLSASPATSPADKVEHVVPEAAHGP